MTVYRELGELANRMAKVITLFWQCYVGPLTDEMIQQLEDEIEDLKADLDAVLINLKGVA